MNIGFDARWYFDGPVSGKLVVRNLLENLLYSDSVRIWPIFRLRDKKRVKKKFGNINCIYTKRNNLLISNVFEIPFIKKANEMDLIIFQNFNPIFGKFKKVNYIHDIIFEDSPRYYTLIERIYFKPMRYCSRFADLVITISNHEKERIIKHNYSKNVEYVHHGIDKLLSQFSNQDADRLNLPKKYILMVGRLNKRKNIGNLLKSIPMIEDKDVKLVIVGERDWKNPDIDSLLEKEEIKSKVIFYSNLTTEQLGAVYNFSKALCFVSFDEGFGLPIIEAMNFGIPVIVSNTSVMPEIAGSAGININPYNSKSIASSINRIFSDQDFYHRYSMLSKERSKNFSWEQSSKKIIKLCKEYVKTN